jgi:choline monooxygenase
MANLTHPRLTEAEIAAVRAPIEQARTLPSHAFTSPEFFDFEADRVLRNAWMAVAFSDQVQHVGDAITLQILGEPIAVVRLASGEAHAFHNVCPYDGCEVLLESATSLDQFVTPYHG